MKKYEYQYIDWSVGASLDMIRINKVGSEGWSIVASGGGVDRGKINRNWVMMQREVVQSDFNKAAFDKSGTVKTMVQGMVDTLSDILVEARKHDTGNSAAGTRVRMAMQNIKGTAQDVRKRVQKEKNRR